MRLTHHRQRAAPAKLKQWSKLSATEKKLAIKTVPVEKIPKTLACYDVGPKSLKLFKAVLANSKTVVWNGPAGVFEFSNFAAGTIGICEVLSKIDAVTIIGGGDSAAAAIQFGYADKFTHISTGGGASLEYLEGKVLPGVAIVDEV